MMKLTSIMKALSHPSLRLGVLLTCFMSATAGAWTPGVGDPDATVGLAVDRFDRLDVLSFYNCSYQASEDYAAKINWTGDITTCDPGTTAAAFKDDVLRRVNYYRAMVGMPGNITFDTTNSSKSQQAALMMSAEGEGSHFPGTDWECYTIEGAEAAEKSLLALGSYGPDSIDQYMFDAGVANMPVGHRRWILYSRAPMMGTGDVPASNGQPAANALWFRGVLGLLPTPQFVAWPNDGYVPVSLVPARWSLSYPGADFANATVTMTHMGSNVPLTVIDSSTSFVGDNSIVWESTGIPSDVTVDTAYEVTVTNILGGGPSSKTYTVTLMNPDVLGDSVSIEGTETPPSSGQIYTFNGIAGSSSYELEVSAFNTSAWIEGAEDSPIPNITDETSVGYDLRQGNLERTGSKAFQLTYPSGDWSDQSFVVTRDMIPGATSKLEFYQQARFSAPSTTLEAQVSTDSGNTWTTVWGRVGVNVNGSGSWLETSWNLESIDLAVYQSQPIHLRFIVKNNGLGVYQGTTSEYGFFIDDITVTDSSFLDNSETTTLSSEATSFTLNSLTAGKTLAVDDLVVMRIRPNVGCRWFSFGANKEVTVVTPTGYDLWFITNYPALTGGFSGDDDGDGVANGVEYAFDLNPLVVNTASDFPQAEISGGFLMIAYPDPGVTGISYEAEWSSNLTDWNDITDTGVGGVGYEFKVSTSGQELLFIRHCITKP